MTPGELRQAVVFAARFEVFAQRFRLRATGALLEVNPTIPVGGIPASWEPVENPARVREYWADVLPPATPTRDYPPQWCGAFCLFAIHRAELGLDVFWKGGFLARRCRLLGAHEAPQAGDVAFFERYQHHAIVEAVDVERRTFDSIDGNQGPGIVRHTGRPFAAVRGFYSIDPLIEAREAHGPTE